LHTYIIKNTSGLTIRLISSEESELGVGGLDWDDCVINIDPGEMFSMESEELLSPVFQKLYRQGDIDWWHMPSSIKRSIKRCKVNWKKEGF